MSEETVTLLLVEDNPIDVEAVRRAFRKLKIANPIRVARDGLEAMQLLTDVNDPFPRPVLVLLDLNMPRMNGIEFLRELRSHDDLQDTLVFVLTTSQADEDIVASYQLNVAGYIVKTDVGSGFIQAVRMLDHYWHVIRFPVGKQR